LVYNDLIVCVIRCTHYRGSSTDKTHKTGRVERSLNECSLNEWTEALVCGAINKQVVINRTSNDSSLVTRSLGFIVVVCSPSSESVLPA